MRGTFTLLTLVCAVVLQGCHREKSATGITIAVIPKGTTHVYWKSVEAGARQAGKDLGVTIKWKGPLKENDRAQQISIVEQFVGDRIDGIVLAPLDDTALVNPVQEAAAAKIPVVIIDSGLKAQAGKDFVSYVATDNHQGGRLAGEQLAKLLGKKGKVVMLRYEEGSASTTEREAGFLEVMDANPDIHVIVKNRYGGATDSEAQTAAMNLLDQIKQADGIFCPNESSTQGMLKALRDTGLAGKKMFVGFDATPQLVEALKAGEINALVAQDPVKMGYEGVKAAVAAIKHQPVQQRIDTGVRVITREDLEKPEVKKFLGR